MSIARRANGVVTDTHKGRPGFFIYLRDRRRRPESGFGGHAPVAAQSHTHMPRPNGPRRRRLETCRRYDRDASECVGPTDEVDVRRLIRREIEEKVQRRIDGSTIQYRRGGRAHIEDAAYAGHPAFAKILSQTETNPRVSNGGLARRRQRSASEALAVGAAKPCAGAGGATSGRPTPRAILRPGRTLVQSRRAHPRTRRSPARSAVRDPIAQHAVS